MISKIIFIILYILTGRIGFEPISQGSKPCTLTKYANAQYLRRDSNPYYTIRSRIVYPISLRRHVTDDTGIEPAFFDSESNELAFVLIAYRDYDRIRTYKY